MRKSRFYSIRNKDGEYEGMFIAPDEKIAREMAKNNGFKVTDETVFEDVTVEKTEIDKLHEDTIVE